MTVKYHTGPVSRYGADSSRYPEDGEKAAGFRVKDGMDKNMYAYLVIARNQNDLY